MERSLDCLPNREDARLRGSVMVQLRLITCSVLVGLTTKALVFYGREEHETSLAFRVSSPITQMQLKADSKCNAVPFTIVASPVRKRRAFDGNSLAEFVIDIKTAKWNGPSSEHEKEC